MCGCRTEDSNAFNVYTNALTHTQTQASTPLNAVRDFSDNTGISFKRGRVGDGGRGRERDKEKEREGGKGERIKSSAQQEQKHTSDKRDPFSNFQMGLQQKLFASIFHRNRFQFDGKEGRERKREQSIFHKTNHIFPIFFF